MALVNAFGELAQEHVTPSGAHLVGNARTKFRDGFASPGTQPDPAVWVSSNEHPSDHIINQGGDSTGSSYLRISMSPFVDNSEVTLTSIDKFRFPTRVGWSVSTSQRVVGQEVFFGLVEADDVDSLGINRDVDPGANRTITANGTVTSNVLTVTSPNHGFKSGDRVNIINCPDTRMNAGPLTVTTTGYNTFTVPLTIANGTYTMTGGGEVKHIDPLSRANNAVGYLLENATVTNATFASRRNQSKYRLRNSTIATTANIQGNSAGWNDSYSGNLHELWCSMDECQYRSFTADGNSAMSGGDKYHQGFPDEELAYRLHLRARNLQCMSRPIAQITNIAKSGSTTATVTTDVPHNLTTNSRVGIYGVRDQTNFVNTNDMAVASVVNATTFTAVMGASATASDALGGVVFLNHGLVLSPGAFNFAVTSIARDADGMVTAVLNGTASGFNTGEYIHLWGMNASGAPAFDGAYKVQSTSTSSLFLEPATGRVQGSIVGAITTGGALIRRTDVRLHFARVLDYTRVLTEVVGGKGNTTDQNNAVPVSITSGMVTSQPSLSSSSTTAGTLVTKILSAASTNATNFKTSAGRIYGYHLSNTTAAWKYVRLYAKTTAPTVGTDVPVMVIPLAPNSTELVSLPVPFTIATGLGYAITGASPDLDATAVAVGDVVGHILYV